MKQPREELLEDDREIGCDLKCRLKGKVLHEDRKFDCRQVLSVEDSQINR